MTPHIINIPDRRPVHRRGPASTQPSESSRRNVIVWLLALTTAGVLFCGLFPFDFVFHFHTAAQEIQRRFDTTIHQLYTAGDGLENVFFFVPTGFALTAFLWNGSKKQWPALARCAAIVIAGGAILSLVVELSQVFLVSRDPSLADFVSNTTGTAVGFGLFLGIGPTLIGFLAKQFDRLDRTLNPTALLALSGIWLLLAVLLPLMRGEVGSLVDWNRTYPLMIGNETTGDRPWEGTVRSLCIADRALDDSELDRVLAGTDAATILRDNLLSTYSFQGRGPYPDGSKLGGALHWNGGKSNSPASRPADPVPPMLSVMSGLTHLGVTAADGWWLRTEEGAESAVSHRIAEHNAFSLIADVQTDDLQQQNGPPRIVSISQDTTRCNLQLLQETDALYIRLRTVASGEGGTDPEFVLPNVFTDNGPQRVVVTYDHGLLMATTDRLGDRNTFRFTPESSLIWQIYPRPGWAFRLDSGGQSVCAKIYRVLAMLPIGYLVSLAAVRLRSRGGMKRFATQTAMWLSVLIAVLVVELTLWAGSRQLPGVGTLLVSIIAAASGVLIADVAICHDQLRRFGFR